MAAPTATATGLAAPNTATFIAVSGIVLLAAIVAMLFFVQIPQANDKTVTLVVGSMLQWIGWIFGYYYGSSTSSKAKDDTIGTLAIAASGTGTGTSTTTTAPTPEVKIP